MAQGQKTDNETLYKIMLCWYITRNYSEVERRLGINRKTVKELVEKHRDDEEFTKLFQQKKEEFVETADRIINKATMLLEKRLDTALEKQDELEDLIYDVYNADKEEISPQEKKSVVSNLRKLQVNGLSEITTAIGTLYDKKALAQNGEVGSETPVININIVDNGVTTEEKALYNDYENN